MMKRTSKSTPRLYSRPLLETGEYFRLALAMGLMDHSDIVAWADTMISRLEEPPIELIDISLGNRLSSFEMMKLLAALPGPGNREAAAHRVLGLLRDKLQRGEFTIGEAVKSLTAYYNWATVSKSEGLLAYNFDDALYCAEMGYYGTPESVRAELDEFIAEYGSDPDTA